ncbi:hypothetical protein JIM95_009655, partial [Corynebacterium sp. CCM 8835]
MTRQLSRAGAVLFAIFLIATALVVAPATAGADENKWEVYLREQSRGVGWSSKPFERRSVSDSDQHVYCVDLEPAAPGKFKVNETPRVSYVKTQYGIDDVNHPLGLLGVEQARKVGLAIAITRELSKPVNDRVQLDGLLDWSTLDYHSDYVYGITQYVSWKLGSDSPGGKTVDTVIEKNLSFLKENDKATGDRIVSAVNQAFKKNPPSAPSNVVIVFYQGNNSLYQNFM